MADKYEGLDEAALNDLLSKAENYEERSAIRKALRNVKGSKTKKHVGSASYRRAGWQAPKSMLIPNSVTGNVLPNKVNVTDNKVESPQTKATISYLKGGKEATYGEQTRRRSSGQGPRGSSPRSSPRESVSSYTSVTPEPKELAEPEKAPEVVKAETIEDAQSPEPPREPSPEPIYEPSPEPEREPSPPPREPTPEPPREPTPEPPREPTPEPTPPREPTPEPEREPTPEPPREPTPEPVREPSPEPVREPTPEPELSTEPEEDGEVGGSAEEDEEDEEEEEREDEDEDERAERLARGDKDSHQYQAGRSTYDPSKVGVKTSLPIEVLSHKEEGIDGDFRKKLRKAEETKIDTTKAFPQARTKGEQVDFRNVLRKSTGPERKDIKTGASAQSDFRSSLKGRPSADSPPEVKPKSRRRRDEPVDEEPVQQETEPVEEAEPEPVEPVESVEGDEEPEEQPQEEEPEEQPQEEEPEEQEQPAEDEVDAVPEPEQPKEPESESYEARMAERRRRRAEKSKEREEVKKETPVENGTGADDSYEARREARRKAREERLKAASAMVDDKPRLSYRERKAQEAKKQMDNARESRSKWANREEESGDKAEAKGANFKKKEGATQQLLAWCQHKTKYYENVDVKDFRQSWADGMAFCAILHSFLPDKIPYDDLSPSDPRTNFTIAFEAAKDAGIPEMLDVEDMVSVRVPDAKSIMTFLVTIYQHFN